MTSGIRSPDGTDVDEPASGPRTSGPVPEVDEVPDEVLRRQAAERQAAVREVLAVLRSPLALMSVPTRAETLEKVRRHGITVEELFEAAIRRAQNA